MDKLQLLRGKDYAITKSIKIYQPTLNEIFEYGEQEYFSMVQTLTSTPSDLKSYLFDTGIDYEKISEFQLFSQILNKSFDVSKTSILFGNDLDLSSLKLKHDDRNQNDIVLCSLNEDGFFYEGNVIINDYIYELMVDYIRQMHGFKKNTEKAGNAFTKKILIEEDRMKRNTNKQFESFLYPLILSMVNCSDFPYTFETVWNLPISVFIASVGQVQRLKNVGYTMQGVCSGNIDMKKIDKDELKWI